MAELIAVCDLLADGRERAQPVARVGCELISRERFLADVARWREGFAARPEIGWALYFEQAYPFACALFGAWAAGKAVALPADDRPATRARLLQSGWALAGDISQPHLAPQDVSRLSSPAVQLRLNGTEQRLTVYTSGSQGEPAAIEKKMTQLDAEVQALERAFASRMGPDEQLEVLVSVCSTVSHQHIYGLLFQVLWPLAAGRLIVGPRLAYPQDIVDALAHGPSVLVTSPAHLKRLGDVQIGELARRSLRAVFSSGGPLPFEAAKDAQRLLGQLPIEVFGSSETGGIAWRSSATADQPWCPLPGVSWRVEASGLLAVCSDHLPEAAWTLTSDRAEPAGEGFALRGRADRVIKLEEKRLSLDEVERAVVGTGCFEDARAVLVPSPVEQRIGLVGVLSEGGARRLQHVGRLAFTQGLRQELASILDPLALPRRWRFVPALPVNAQGKTTQAMLLELFRRDRAPLVALRRSGDEATALLAVPPDLALLEGHFPGVPILPGVAQLGWAVQVGRQCFAMPDGVSRLEALKFQQTVQPGAELTLALHWNASAATLSFAYDSARGRHASGRIVWAFQDRGRGPANG